MTSRLTLSAISLVLTSCQVIIGYDAKERAEPSTSVAGASGAGGSSASTAAGGSSSGSGGSPSAGAGGQSAGGNAEGGSSIAGHGAGGSGAGGDGAGGSMGGSSTGGTATGGNPTGGSPTGGASTGGNSTGGNPTGGNGGSPAGGASASGNGGIGPAGAGGESAGGAGGNTCGDAAGSGGIGGVTGAGAVVQIVASDSNTCVLLSTKKIRCWGDNLHGQLGYGVSGNQKVLTPPTTDQDVGGNVVQLAAGLGHTCALLDTGQVRCWGYNISGQLGNKSTKSNGFDMEGGAAAAPFADLPPGETVIQLAAAGSTTCVVTSTGAVRCWGDNTYGQLGVPQAGQMISTPSSYSPITFSDPIAQIGLAASFVCARSMAGFVRCWGNGAYGTQGNLTTFMDIDLASDSTDADVACVPLTSVVSGQVHSCAILTGGALRCWGENKFGEMGLGPSVDDAIGDDETPASVGPVVTNGRVIQVALGYAFTCVLLEDHTVRCWGNDANGELGLSSKQQLGKLELPTTRDPIMLGGEVAQIAAGGEHVCALLSSGPEAGGVRCWGGNSSGQLGLGMTKDVGDDELPTAFPALVFP